MRIAILILIAVLSTVGIADSAYLTLMHFGVAAPRSEWMARACDFEEGSCESVQKFPEATIFGIPSALLAILFYAFVLSAVLVRVFTGSWLLPGAMLGVLIAALGYSAYLSYLLIAQMHIPCPYCLAAHSINLVILMLYGGSLILG